MQKIVGLIIMIVLLSGCATNTASNDKANAAVNQLTPQQTAANYNVQLGMGYLQQGDVQRAKSKLLLAIAQAPDWAPAQEAMGYFLLNTGEAKRAEQYYLRAVHIDPRAGATQNNYGVYLCRVGRYAQAEQHYLLAVQDPNYVNTPEAYENAGLCALQAHDLNKANAYFQHAIQQDPQRATALLELAQINFSQNNFAVAQQYFDRYVQQVNGVQSADSLWLGIQLARKTGDTVRAQQYILALQNNYHGSREYQQLVASTPRHLPK